MNQTTFQALPLKPELIQNLESLGYIQTTQIQAESLPLILKNQDVIAKAQTGSGKTAAFALGILNKLNVKQFRIQTLVLCPTRELADQVANEIRKLARAIHNIKVLTLCGGAPFGPQVGSLAHGAHIIVGTPGRIVDHLERATLTLDNVDTLVLDEADRMLEMGFQDALDAVIAAIPVERQTLLFSATYDNKIKSIANAFMKQPQMIEVKADIKADNISQYFYPVDGGGQRANHLKRILLIHQPQSAIVFCNTKREVQAVQDSLADFGFSVVSLHGDLEQKDRDQALILFSHKSANVLVATDVAARGIDIDSVELVVNYDMAHDPAIHTHRIGRTGRAGNKGIACSLFDEKEAFKVAMLDLASDPVVNPDNLPEQALDRQLVQSALYQTIQIDSGKKQKVRAGDILGALTADKDIDGKQIGKINVYDNWAFIALDSQIAKKALNKLNRNKIKGRSVRARILAL
ncbi:ATP-dependent RNA helicase DbpA [Catenovulum sp. 2E275]|uniref:ATP-dependent RNA helicase DbpA n=1 Tax=Catenovulum sp. 2E275 TaxID=2980497 RepID=UPI0021CE3E8F|nr:ATP-dependent RNA helicase DbpA [Catenovulum sp. 2E275]MCU4676888.1 ATP-dependent RNA helicase DbpA [Catenovulum sp. 2E275]